MKNIFKSLFILISFIQIIHATPIELTQEEQEFLKKHNKFTVCSRINHYPISDIADGKLIGITGDIFFKLSQLLNITFIPIKARSYDELDFLILSGDCDFISTLGKNTSFYENVLTTNTLYKNTFGVLGNSNSIILQNHDEFKGHTFYVKDSIHRNALYNLYPKLHTILIGDIDKIIDIVKKDRFSHYVNSIIILDRVIQKYGPDKLKLNGILAKIQAESAIGIDIDNNPLMLNIINKTLDHIGHQTIENIVQKYRLKQYVIEKDYNIYFVYLLIVLLIIVSIITLYSKKVKKSNKELSDKVKKQTDDILQTQKVLSEHVLFSKTDLKGIITEASDVFCQLSGYTKEELLGKSHNIIRHPDMSPEIFKDMWETIKKDQTWKGEVKNKAKAGHHYWVEAIVFPNYNKSGEQIGYISIRHDITAQKSFEEQQRLLLEQSKMASMGEMIGNIAHQWRQPLSAITTIASTISLKKENDMLKEDELDPYMEDIIRNAEYLSETIDTFRNFIKDDKVKKELVLVDEIKKAILIVQTNLKKNHIVLQDNIDYTIQTKVTMVSNEFSQVLINLFNNAKDILLEKNIENPWIKLDLSIEENKSITITVEDNAGGVPQEILPRIFEPYFTTKHQSQGTGLGLHMSYRIISESLNGKIWVNNTTDGAKFYIELPST